MVRDGKVINGARNVRKKVKSKSGSSDDSDEDYVVENDDVTSEDDDLEDIVNSFDGNISDASLQGLVEYEDEDVLVANTTRSRKRKKENRQFGCKISKRRKVALYEMDDEDYVVDDVEANDDVDASSEQELEKELVDKEFNPDEEDEDFESLPKMYHNDTFRGHRTRKRSARRCESTKFGGFHNSSLLSNASRKLRKKSNNSVVVEDDVELADSSSPTCRKRYRSKKASQSRKRKVYISESDSDFCFSPGSSDYEYTISEEEREQMKEANKLRGELKSCPRRQASTKGVQVNGKGYSQKENIKRKGKEKALVKAALLKAELVKQVCGICLSEEEKRRSKGILSCCSHYFCFACIMEWSKVESRCPLCKQRFNTITKHGRSANGVDLRNVVIEIPERDQVYQPTEEEIRSFIDPYEHVICTECHQGGDDGLMLLCDICDSPAHTYCVGLGRQVPEGNWYCHGCKPVALGSSSTHFQDPFSDSRAPLENTMLDVPVSVGNSGESSEFISELSPRLLFFQGFGMPSPRFTGPDFIPVSPMSGAGAATLSVRRQIHRHIQYLISNRMNYMSARPDDLSGANVRSELLNSPMRQAREAALRNTSMQETRTLGGQSTTNGHSYPLTPDISFVSSRHGESGNQDTQLQLFETVNRSPSLTLWPTHQENNLIHTCEQVCYPNDRSGIDPSPNLPIYRVSEDNQFYHLKEQLQSMVKTHLMSMSQGTSIGNDDITEITRSATHTILAACGFEHRLSEVQVAPPLAVCTHFERVAAGDLCMMKGFCSACFDSFVRDVVKRILDTMLPQWLSLGL